MYREFECLCPDLNIVYLNTSATSENIPVIECQSRVIKKIMRAIWSKILFKTVPGTIVAEFFYFVVLRLDVFPS